MRLPYQTALARRASKFQHLNVSWIKLPLKNVKFNISMYPRLKYLPKILPKSFLYIEIHKSRGKINVVFR